MDMNRLIFHELPRSLKREFTAKQSEAPPVLRPRLPKGEPYRPLSPEAAEKRQSLRQLRMRTK